MQLMALQLQHHQPTFLHRQHTCLHRQTTCLRPMDMSRLHVGPARQPRCSSWGHGCNVPHHASPQSKDPPSLALTPRLTNSPRCSWTRWATSLASAGPVASSPSSTSPPSLPGPPTRSRRTNASSATSNRCSLPSPTA